jgi:hypothetical protein
MRRLLCACLVLGLAFACRPGMAGDPKPKKSDENGNDPRNTYLSDVPEYAGNVVLGRPTDRSVTLNVMMNRAAKVRVKYGLKGNLDKQTEVFELKQAEPREIVIEGLQPDSAYEYHAVDADSGAALFPEKGNGSFHTQRKPGSEFAFTVQADPHLDGNCLPELYKLVLTSVLDEHPDFHIDLGDTFMTGKIVDHEKSAKQYLAQRYYLGLVGGTSPVFLVVGNHDGEEMFKARAGETDPLAVWSCLQRKRYFSNPIPDTFYSGNSEKNAEAGQLQDYYAWEWGDALFVTLNPYWYTGGNKSGGGKGDKGDKGPKGDSGKSQWNMTLGKTQYDWLVKTLRASKAKFKFMFIHQLVGGAGKDGRGGSEAAAFYEWGGNDEDGKDTFAPNRPGWEKPIHDLLVETGVTIVFHGHDHFFGKQEKDGIIYQLVPQPANQNIKRHQAEEYGYGKGDFQPASGHVLVRVGPKKVTVDYIRAVGKDMKVDGGISNGKSSFSYDCGPHGK